MERFEIRFDNPIATYYSGQHVTGQLMLKLSKEKRLRAIELKFVGDAEVRWNESYSHTQHGRRHHRTITYYCREIYVENSVFVLGNPDADITLPPGEYSYNFALILPVTAPSSFEDEVGRVRYTVKAKIDRPWRFNHECKTAFTVLNILDLNNCLNVQSPLMTSVEKFLCCGCCRSRPITVVLSLPFTGFVPGQKCPAAVEVDNQSNQRVSIKCYLVQRVTFTGYCGSMGKSMVARRVVAQEKLGAVERRGSKTFPLSMVIPALPASFLLYCTIIEIAYVLEVEGVVSGLHANATMELPVVIGTIPLRNQFQSLVPAACTSGDNVAYVPAVSRETTAQNIIAVPPGNDYADMPPPSYEECVSGRVNIRSEEDDSNLQGNTDFAPRYPIYHFK